MIAPAGSGKTRVLTERLRYLVGSRRGRPLHGDGAGLQPKGGRRADGAIRQPARQAGVPTSGPSTAWASGSATPTGASGRLRVMEEPAVRELVQGVFEVRRQANTDTVLPYIDALSSVRLGPGTHRTSVEETHSRCPGPG